MTVAGATGLLYSPAQPLAIAITLLLAPEKSMRRPSSSCYLTLPALIGLALLVPVPARAADLTCPMAIEVTQKLAAPQRGWTEGADKLPIELSGIAVFDGPPSEMADLAPDEGPKTADTVSDTWE